MRLARRTFLGLATAAVAAPAVSRWARADAPQLTFKLHHFFSSVSCGHDRFLAPWARKIEAESAGRIRIDIFPSMQLGGRPAQLFDQARDGLVDIAWAAPSRTPGRFPRIELFELPFVPARRAFVSSKAIEDYAAANLKDEFREVHPICFSCTDCGVVHANRPIRIIEECKGLRLQVQTRFAGEAVRALGARAVAMPSAELPAAIARRVVDGCIDPWHMAPALKLYDLLRTHTDFAESSLSTMTFVLAMNKAAYDRLPPDLKTVIDNNSGQFAAGMAGAMWDAAAAAVADMVVRRGDAIMTLLPEAVAHWRTATAPVIAAWLKQMTARKIDGERLLASAGALMAKYANEPEPQPLQPPRPAVATDPPPPHAKAEIPATPTPNAVTPSVAPQSPAAEPVPASVAPRQELNIPL